jgi:hypothetical protein
VTAAPLLRPMTQASARSAPWQLLTGAAPLAVLFACGGAENAAPIVVPTVTPEESILQVSPRWNSIEDDRRLLDPPSQTAIHWRRTESQVDLSNRKPVERLKISQSYEDRSGQTMNCAAEATVPLKARYGWRNGEASVRLERPATRIDYRCAPAVPQDLTPTLPASTIELVLRDETLVVVQPATDHRRLQPQD